MRKIKQINNNDYFNFKFQPYFCRFKKKALLIDTQAWLRFYIQLFEVQETV